MRDRGPDRVRTFDQGVLQRGAKRGEVVVDLGEPAGLRVGPDPGFAVQQVLHPGDLLPTDVDGLVLALGLPTVRPYGGQLGEAGGTSRSARTQRHEHRAVYQLGQPVDGGRLVEVGQSAG